jgi:uncharacterized protein YraI
MRKHTNIAVPVMLILGMIASGCNLPSAVKAPEVSPEEIANTAVAAAFTAQAAAALSATPAGPAGPAPGSASQCSPTVTANVNANVRSGPTTDYSPVGSLPTGGTAAIAGRNDAGTWWFISFPGGPGGYGWIAGSVVTASCLPQVVQVVAAPPLPAAPPPQDEPEAAEPTADPGTWSGPLLIPGLIFAIPTATPIIFDIPDWGLPDLGDLPFP